MSDEQFKGFISIFQVYHVAILGEDDMDEKEIAYQNLRKMIKPIPKLDYDKELAEYREEKYGKE